MSSLLPDGTSSLRPAPAPAEKPKATKGKSTKPKAEKPKASK